MSEPSSWHERSTRWLRARVARLRTPAGVVFALCFVALFGMYCSNTDWGGDPHTPRGDGKYRPVLARGDGHMMFMMTQSLVLDGDLVYDNQLAAFGDPWRQPRTKTGRKMIPHPIGPSLVQAPVFAFAHVTSKALNLLGAGISGHGYTMYHQRLVFSLSVLAGLGAVLLGFVAARRWIGGRWGPLYAAVAVLFGTSLTYYATYMPSYAHALDALACAAFLGYWTLTFDQWRWQRFVVLGVLLGAAALIRVTGFGLGVVVAVEVFARAVRRPSDDERSGAQVRARYILRLFGFGALTLAVALVTFVPQLVTWKLVFGEWVTSPMGPRFMRLGEPEWMELLFSSRNGWLSTHPIAYAGVVGLLFVPRRARVIAGALLAVLVIQVYANACVFDWWAGASFGQRRLCSLTFVCVFGLAALLRAGGIATRRLPVWSRHLIGVLVLGWFVVWNLAQVQRLRGGKAANSTTRPMCCRQVPRPLSTIARPIYKRFGNPFALPASLIHSWRYGVTLQRWDTTVGRYADLPDLRLYNNDQHRRRTRGWNFPTGYLTGGFGPPQRHQRTVYRWTTSARAGLLVPLFVANEPRTFSLWVMPNPRDSSGPPRVEIAVNGSTYVDRELRAGWNRMVFTVPAGGLHRGINQLVVRSPPRPHAAPSWPPPPNVPAVGVAVRDLTLGYPTP